MDRLTGRGVLLTYSALPSVNESENVMDWSFLHVRLCVCVCVSGQTLTVCTHTPTISLLSKHNLHTHTQSCRVAISHSVRSDSPQWLVSNTGQPVHLPATAHHHTH